MKSILSAFFSVCGSLLVIVLMAAFVGILCGLGMWSCDAVRGLLP